MMPTIVSVLGRWVDEVVDVCDASSLDASGDDKLVGVVHARNAVSQKQVSQLSFKTMSYSYSSSV